MHFSYLLALLPHASSLAATLPLLIGMYRLRVLNRTQCLLWGICLSELVVEQLAKVLWHQQANNLWLYNLLLIIEPIVWGAIYNRQFTGRVLPKVARWWAVGFVLFVVVNGIWWQPFVTTLGLHAFTALVASMVAFALLYFAQQLKNKHMLPFSSNYMLWVNSGNLLYYTGSLFYFIVLNFIKSNSPEGQLVFTMNALFNITRMALYAKALWMQPVAPSR